MNQKTNSRRTFLRRVGVAACALAVSTLPAEAAPATHATRLPSARKQALRVGVLLPNSRRYPELGRSMLAGMQLADAAHGSLELLPLEYGVSPAQALNQAQTLITEARVDALVSTTSANVAATLHPLLTERQVPILVSSAGANILRSDRLSPWMVRNSLGYWQSAWALGHWAAQHIGPRAVLASSFYDSGYDTVYAFRLGFESAGGTVIDTVVTHLPNGNDLTTTLDQIHAQRPDLVCGFACANEAGELLQAYAAHPLARSTPLIGTGFLTDEHILATHGGAALGIHTALPWSPALETAENQEFIAAFRAAQRRPADAFALLGYEAATLLASAHTARAGSSAAALLYALRHTTLDSPRGRISSDAAAGETVSPLYLRQVQDSGAGLSNRIIATLPAVPTHDPQIAALRDGLRTGWQEAYLCI